MGISSSVSLECEEVTLLPPTVTLPLDITRFTSPDWKLGIPPSLLEFHTLSRQLHQQLSRLPANNAEMHPDWIQQGTVWSQEVTAILRNMHSITQALLRKMPADLRGNVHPVEEYAADIATAIDQFDSIVRPLRRAGPADTALANRALKSIRGIYLFSKR